jgi:hypothetical protein
LTNIGTGGGEQGFTSSLEWALAYARIGWRIFPCSADKHPILRLAPHWSRDASTDPETIEGWCAKAPFADIGFAIDSETVVADGDMSGGQRGVADIERLAGMPVDAILTVIATTPSGGRHVYFRRAAGTRPYLNGRLPGADVDIKGGGANAYVVLPGFANGRRWIRAPWEIGLAPAPSWLEARRKPEREPLVLAPASVLQRPPAAVSTPSDPVTHRRALAVLGRACQRIASAPCGSQYTTLRNETFMIGGILERDGLGYADAYQALLGAARRMPAYRGPWRGLEAMIARMLEDGMAKSLPVSETELWLRELRARLTARKDAARAAR